MPLYTYGHVYMSFASDTDGCEIWKMEESYAGEIESSASCGILLSPRFPGYVEPGYWAWLIEGMDNFYFDIYVYYVRGPELSGGDCGQYFQSKLYPNFFSAISFFQSLCMVIKGGFLDMYTCVYMYILYICSYGSIKGCG